MPLDPKPEDWSILGVDPGCTWVDARAAYLRRATALHPDRHPDVEGVERLRLDRAMAALNAAWERIEAWSGWTDGERRAAAEPEAPPYSERREVDDPPGPLPAPPDGFIVLRQRGDGHLGDHIELRGASRDLLRLPDWSGVPYEGLRCADRPVDEDHLAVALRALPHLRSLRLEGSGVGDRTATRLPELVPGLTTLHLSDTRVTDRGVAAIARLGQLHSLTLDGTAVTDAGVSHLAGHANLAMLNLRATEVKGPALRGLADCPLLHLLGLGRVRRADRQALARRRPDLTIT